MGKPPISECTNSAFTSAHTYRQLIHSDIYQKPMSTNKHVQCTNYIELCLTGTEAAESATD